MIVAEGIPSQEMYQVLTLIFELSSQYWWLLLTVVSAYLFATYWYWRHSVEVDDEIHIAPISVKGGISKELGSREVGLLLHTHLGSIMETFSKAKSSQTSAFAAEAVTVYFPSLNTALVDAPLTLGQSELNVKEEVVVSIGSVQIPVGAIINLFLALLRILPVPYKKRYLASLINISLVSAANETQLLVYRKWQRPLPSDSSPLGAMYQSGSGPILLTKTAGTKNLTGFDDMLRDAAFMILQLHGSFEGRNWLGMRCFADGLDALDEYRQTTRDELLNTAKDHFAHAVAADKNNYEAIYFYGSMLLFERTRESIAMAIRFFQRALDSKKLQLELEALVNAGLSHCYAQQFHRLAKRGTDVLVKAHEHAKTAQEQWEKAEQERKKALGSDKSKPHPWILYTLALSGIADEGSGCDLREVKKRFLISANYLLQAIEMEPDNGMFYNTLGWLFLKLAQLGIEDLKAEDGIPPKIQGSTIKKAEDYIRLALDLNPENKMSHANLCLLYATPPYSEKQEEYLVRCRYHGLKSIQIDPEYINGHRDLTLSLIRYGQFEEAKKHFENALRFAAVVDKDLEIIKDVVKALEDKKCPEEMLKYFRHPNSQLLEPPK